MAIGIIPIGLRDGYFKKNSSIGSTLIHGKRVSVLNGLHFEHTRIDLADLPEAGIGDKVVLIGKQADEEISLGEIVKFRGTDLHEICQSVRNHIPRIYFSVIVMRILDIIGSEDPSLWDLTDTASAIWTNAGRRPDAISEPIIMKRNGLSSRFPPASENIRVRSTTDVFFYDVFLSQSIPLEGKKVVC